VNTINKPHPPKKKNEEEKTAPKDYDCEIGHRKDKHVNGNAMPPFEPFHQGIHFGLNFRV